MLTAENMPKGGWLEVPAGTEISEELYMEKLNELPMLTLWKSPYTGFQCPEQYDRRYDENGRLRGTYMTFIKSDGRFYYAGIQYRGECRYRLP